VLDQKVRDHLSLDQEVGSLLDACLNLYPVYETVEEAQGKEVWTETPTICQILLYVKRILMT
jgi:hypothetical protein